MAISDTRESASAEARAIRRALATPTLAALLVLLRAPIALAMDGKGGGSSVVDACASASERGQELRDQGKLLSARARFVECAVEACPGVIRRDCADWLVDIEKKIPSIVVRARDAQGRDASDVRVLVDGEERAPSLDGRALSLDPGPRTLRFERAGAEAVVQSIVAREGEKSRLVDVVVGGSGGAGGAGGAAVAPAASSPGRGIPFASWALMGGAALGGAVFTFFGVSAKNSVDEMRSTCAPFCDPDRVDAARRDAIIANVGLGAGVAALGAAVIIAVAARPAQASWSPPSGAAGRASITVELDVGGALSGGGLGVRGRF